VAQIIKWYQSNLGPIRTRHTFRKRIKNI